MMQDIENGRELEFEAITGSILQSAERAGIDAPLNRLLYRLMKAALYGQNIRDGQALPD